MGRHDDLKAFEAQRTQMRFFPDQAGIQTEESSFLGGDLRLAPIARGERESLDDAAGLREKHLVKVSELDRSAAGGLELLLQFAFAERPSRHNEHGSTGNQQHCDSNDNQQDLAGL